KPIPLVLVPAVLGRGAGVDVDLAHPTISRHHAEIGWDDAGFSIVDLGSRSGTLVNGAVVRARTRLSHRAGVARAALGPRFRRAEQIPDLKPPPPPPAPEADAPAPKTEFTKSITERLPTRLRPKLRPGEDVAHLHMRERVRATAAVVIAGCAA